MTPATDSTSLAAAGVTIPPDYHASIGDSPTKGAKAKALVPLLRWAIHDGQTTTELGCPPPPKGIVAMAEKMLTTTSCRADNHPDALAGHATKMQTI